VTSGSPSSSARRPESAGPPPAPWPSTAARVVIADRNIDGAKANAAELGSPHTAATADVIHEESVQRLFDETGPVDVVVNCAGFSNVGLITDMPVEDFRSVVDVCLNGAFIVAKHAGRHLREGARWSRSAHSTGAGRRPG
jgi:NAD(P)-dependent dehydrogenase (short-subunit alcohol dehydrogenase family)